MLSKNQIAFVRALHRKKEREAQKLFLAEGEKIAEDILHSDWPIRAIYATEGWFAENRESAGTKCRECYTVSPAELERISCQTTPSGVLMILPAKEIAPPAPDTLEGITLILDGVQDPGNLGTIIRTADWFGVRNIIASRHTADLYNPKVIQSTMGSFLRVSVHYPEQLTQWLSSVPREMPVYGALMQGEPLAANILKTPSFLILGSEARGISDPVMPYISHPLTIPGPAASPHAPDSLNVSVAASIFLWEFTNKKSR